MFGVALVGSMVMINSSQPVNGLEDWPASTSWATVGSALPATFEPSDLAWISSTNQLLVVTDGGATASAVAVLNSTDGSIENYWDIDGDLEGVTVTGSDDSVAYIGVENPQQIKEVRLSDGSTLKTWDLNGMVVDSVAGYGMEALTFVPNDYLPTSYGNSASGGMFYAGSQYDGRIYVYDVNLSVSGSTPTLVDAFHPLSGTTDLAALFFDHERHLLYALYDGSNRLVVVDPTTSTHDSVDVQTTYNMDAIATDQEGFALRPATDGRTDTTVYVAQDSGGVLAFTGFPVPAAAVEPEPENPPAENTDEPAEETVITDPECEQTTTTNTTTQTTTPTTTSETLTSNTGSAIEYTGNNIDDDGDGQVDEVNTLADNGRHPIYSQHRLRSKHYWKHAIVSIKRSGRRKIVVCFSDGSRYQYRVFQKHGTVKTIQRVRGTSLAIIRSRKSNKVVLINLSRGSIRDRIHKSTDAIVTLNRHTMHLINK